MLFPIGQSSWYDLGYILSNLANLNKVFSSQIILCFFRNLIIIPRVTHISQKCKSYLPVFVKLGYILLQIENEHVENFIIFNFIFKGVSLNLGCMKYSGHSGSSFYNSLHFIDLFMICIFFQHLTLDLLKVNCIYWICVHNYAYSLSSKVKKSVYFSQIIISLSYLKNSSGRFIWLFQKNPFIYWCTFLKNLILDFCIHVHTCSSCI
jgi:hypothetical protein